MKSAICIRINKTKFYNFFKKKGLTMDDLAKKVGYKDRNGLYNFTTRNVLPLKAAYVASELLDIPFDDLPFLDDPANDIIKNDIPLAIIPEKTREHMLQEIRGMLSKSFDNLKISKELRVMYPDYFLCGQKLIDVSSKKEFTKEDFDAFLGEPRNKNDEYYSKMKTIASIMDHLDRISKYVPYTELEKLVDDYRRMLL